MTALPGTVILNDPDLYVTEVSVEKLSVQGDDKQGPRLTGFDKLNEKEKGEPGVVKGVVGFVEP
jgi:hypothetical protein